MIDKSVAGPLPGRALIMMGAQTRITGRWGREGGRQLIGIGRISWIFVHGRMGRSETI